MRRLAAALLATTLLLAGCADDAPQVTGPLSGVTVEGAIGSAPTVTFEPPFTVAEPVATVETDGTGDALESGQRLSINYVALSGEDGSSLASTWEAGATESLVLGDETILAALNDVLTGQKVGVRIMFAAPGGEATDTTEAYPATVMVIEVTGIAANRAQGTAVVPPAGLPIVTLAADGEPSIEVPAGVAEPTELIVQPLIEGAGAVVEAGQTAVVHYTGWLWDGTAFDSSWQSQPRPMPLGAGQVIPAWDEGLVGQAVGSQVLLVVPADKGFGEAGSGAIPPNASLIFVVDILEAS